MATFAQICSSVLEESDGRVVTFSSTNLGTDSNGALYVTDPTQRNVIKWVSQAYREILDMTPYWSFLHRRGTLFKVSAGKATYPSTTPRVRDGSLFFRATGSTARIPVYLESYAWWTELQQALVVSAGYPMYLVDAPDDSYLVWPTPTASGEIYGDYWVIGEDLSTASDEPIWNERYHDLLIWRALQKFSTEFAGEGAGQILEARIALSFPSRWNAFKREYYPASSSPCVSM